MRVQARRAVCAVVLATVVGASQWMLKADVPEVAAGSWIGAGDLTAIPADTAAVALADGRLVVAGGRNADGTLVSQIGIYDPAARSWEDGGQLVTARANHTATLLKDGRVLFAGGRTLQGVSFDIEIYDPATHESGHAGDLWTPRTNHAAAELQDGTVLIVGGSDGSALLGYAELFDPLTGQTQNVVAMLRVPREKLTATTMLDGHVLVAGGRNADGDLAVAELFDPPSQSFFDTGSMRAARSGHVAVLLPNNNQVLIAGGTIAAQASASAELYSDWRDGFSPAPNDMAVPRVGAIGGGLLPYDLAIVAGGGSTTAEFYGYATVKTDKDDYLPGETVTISGSGWQPGETVKLKVSEDADTHYDFNFEAVADINGNIVNREFAPIENEVFHHLGMRFYLVAKGVASEALNTFTDGDKVTAAYAGAQAPNPVVKGSTATYGVSVTATSTANSAVSVALSIVAGASPVPAGVSVTPATRALGAPRDASAALCVAGRGIPAGSRCYASFDVTVATTAATPAGTYDLKLHLNGTGNDVVDAAFTLVVRGTTSTAISCSPNSVEVNQTTTCTATVTDTSGGTAAPPAGTVTFATSGSGTFSASACTLSGASSPTSCAVTYTPSLVGSGSHAITGSYSATSNHGDSSNVASPFNLTVTKATQALLTLTTPAGIVYGGIDGASATGGSGTGAVTFSAGASNGCTVDANTGVITAINATGTCAITVTKAADVNYFAATAGPKTVALQAAALTVIADAKTKEYGASDPAFTYSVTGFKFSDTPASVITGALTRAGGETVSGGPYAITQGSLAANGNYAISFTSADLTITAATLTVTANGQTKQYGDDDPTLTYSATGFKFSDTAASVLTGNLARAEGETVAGSPYAIGQGTLAANGNYTISFTGANLAITPATLTVTANAQTKQYGDDDPTLTYSVNGFKFTDNAAAVLTGTLSRAEGESVTGSPYAIGQGSLAANGNYTTSFTGANLTITAATLTVTANGQMKQYGDDDPALTYSVNGFKFTDNAASVLTGTLTRANGETVAGSPYAIGQGSLAANANYAISFTGANLSITAATLTVTANAQTKQYGEDDPTLTYSVNGFKLTDTAASVLTGNLTRANGESVAGSPYAIGQGSLAANANYTISFTGANLTVTAATLTVTANAQTKKYGDADPALTYTVNGLKLTDTAASVLTGNLTRTPGQTVAGSPYAIGQGSLSVNTNYTLSFTGSTLSIDPRPATVTADNKSRPYNTANPALTATLTNVVTGESLNYSLATSATTASDAGDYPITVTLGANPNYLVTPVDGTLTIVKATQTISFGAIPGPKAFGDVFTVTPPPAATSGLTVALNASGSCTVAGMVVTVTGVTTCKLTASQNGNVNYHAAQPVEQSFGSVYTWSNFLQPINNDGSSVFKLGSTIPVKFQLTGASASVGNLVARIYVAKMSNGVAGSEEEPFTNVNADAGNVFRYDAAAKQYIFNWGTKGLTEGTWQIRIDLGDNALHVVNVSLRK